MTSPKNIIPAQQLTNAAATYYTVPDKTRTVVKKLTFTNTTAGALTVTVYFVARGGTAADGNTLVKTIVVAAAGNRPVDLTEAIDHVLEQGSTIQALASAAASVTIRASGIEIS